MTAVAILYYVIYLGLLDVAVYYTYLASRVCVKVADYFLVMSTVRLKCRSKSGEHSITDLTSDSTFMELKAYVLSLTGIDHDRLLLKSGFPPTQIFASE